jgi:hypothetical protein
VVVDRRRIQRGGTRVVQGQCKWRVRSARWWGIVVWMVSPRWGS